MLKILLNDQAWAPTDLQARMLDKRRQGPGAPAGPASPNSGVPEVLGQGQCRLEKEGLGGTSVAQGNGPSQASRENPSGCPPLVGVEKDPAPVHKRLPQAAKLSSGDCDEVQRSQPANTRQGSAPSTLSQKWDQAQPSPAGAPAPVWMDSPPLTCPGMSTWPNPRRITVPGVGS